MAEALQWPVEVISAASEQFTRPVTGYLWMPLPEGAALVGRVYMDLQARFADGRLIRTSAIMSLRQELGYLVADTFSGSCYVLVPPAPAS
ncbi:hypothetical protein V2K16_14400 [Pseudomonas alliivorans]|uniref:hypothetical protein n=1 Tax=Pseudomonas alliivorans TaxID=2810613 RepID=UPI001AE395A2|nr:hypothetical protein [Pseudomonas alliivorans]MBP0941014.1 hypothetical protein [Pseudomonas alliivorans]MEE4879984.1 hypothetical protein [Pseudomonas alliivorans]MEE4930868.1 hypothetical protein [Pseudomonas alliivorans]MEE4936142.1 hypothetical protein [Pseudomonas alliivorans]MEE4940706.1 hypothetical protein [Pseudomonas alliivorans]